VNSKTRHGFVILTAPDAAQALARAEQVRSMIAVDVDTAVLAGTVVAR